MKKNILLYLLLGFLVVMNAIFLFDHFGSANKKRSPAGGPAKFVAKQLQFDASQLEQFDALDRAHQRKIRSIFGQIKESKDALFELLDEETVDSALVEAITAQIAELEQAKELETFRFFRAVGDLCNPDQREKFNDIIKEALHRQGPPGRNGPPGRGPHEGRPPPPRH